MYEYNVYFHQYGYDNYGLNNIMKGQHMQMHALWFTNAVQGAEPQVMTKLKAKLKAEIKESVR